MIKYTKEVLKYTNENNLSKFVLCLSSNKEYTYYTWYDITQYIKDKGEDINKLSRLEIMDKFYEDYGLNSSNSTLLYFDLTSNYKKVTWEN